MLMETTMLNKNILLVNIRTEYQKKVLSSVWGRVFFFGIYNIKLIESYIFPINGIITKQCFFLQNSPR